MERWEGKIAVITGASAGIGLHTAKVLIQNGMIVIGLARRKSKMEEGMMNMKMKGKFYPIECDITSEANVIKAFEYIKNTFGTIHILINNAGKMKKGALTELTTEDLEETIKINLLGLIYCIKQVVNVMKEGGHEGHIINIGSVVGHKIVYIEGFPLNVYPATKFAVRALSETLQNELRDSKIRVTHISPGIVKTEFFDVAGADPAFLDVAPALNTDDVTDAIVYAISTKPHVHIPELSVRHLEDYIR